MASRFVKLFQKKTSSKAKQATQPESSAVAAALEQHHTEVKLPEPVDAPVETLSSLDLGFRDDENYEEDGVLRARDQQPQQ